MRLAVLIGRVERKLLTQNAGELHGACFDKAFELNERYLGTMAKRPFYSSAICLIIVAMILESFARGYMSEHMHLAARRIAASAESHVSILHSTREDKLIVYEHFFDAAGFVFA